MSNFSYNINDIFQISPELSTTGEGKRIVDFNQRLRNIRIYWR
jgi:hypothetical protein